MPYLGSYTGDYLGSYRGDPGLFGFIGKAAKKIGGAILGAHPLGGVVKTGARTIGRAIGRGRPSPTSIAAPGARMPMTRQETMLDLANREVMEMRGPRRRRMNVANPKALRRAIRRQTGFVKLARRALRGTGYTVVSRGSRRPSRVTVRESGPGGVTVR